MTHTKRFQPSEILLMGPGPSCVYPAVYRALGLPTLGHLDPDFIDLMDDTAERLRTAFGTRNRLTMALSGTGSAGMEASFVNFVEPGDRVLVAANGVFGMRMADVAERLGAAVDRLDFEWGKPVDVETVRARIESEPPYTMVGVVHAETSTGALTDVSAIGRIVRESGALYLVDTVTGLGGLPVAVDEWGADIVYSGTQKCLSCPPGLAPFTCSDRAVAKLSSRTGKVPNWYLDLSMIVQYWSGDGARAYHHTAPINMIYGLNAALGCLLDEGIEAVIARHRNAHERLVNGLEDLGLGMLVAPEHRLPMLNSVTVPDGVDEADIRKRLRREHHIEIGAGLGPLAGKVWRIGLMGHTARAENVDRLLDAFRDSLSGCV